MPGGHVGYQGSSLKYNPKQHATQPGERKAGSKTEGPRLWIKGVHVGYRGGQRTQYGGTALIKLQNVDQKEDTQFYLGKRLAYIYKAKRADKEGNRYRVIWGKVMRPHGNSGVVRAKFKKNLPPKALGKRVRCMLYPSNV